MTTTTAEAALTDAAIIELMDANATQAETIRRQEQELVGLRAAKIRLSGEVDIWKRGWQRLEAANIDLRARLKELEAEQGA